MKQQYVTFWAILCVMTFLLTACDKGSKFTIEGIVSGADSQVMYLENVGVSSVTRMDSVKLTPAGKFSFKKPRPDFPDFYRLRLNNQMINFAVDSTETISFEIDAETFATSYTVSGSENCKAIKNITLAHLDANQAIHRLRDEYKKGQLADTTYSRQIAEASEAYKEVARKYIYGAPMSTAAYFALFQQIDGVLLFDLYDKNDSKVYAAVATSFDHYYPESPRALHLHNLALQSIKVIRSQRPIELTGVEQKEVSFLDIELPNIEEENVALSSIAPGKVVLINFTAYTAEWSPALNMELGELYTKYHSKGLEVYQISLDTDLHLWKNAAYNLPWTCVRDPQSIYSQAAVSYNVQQLPALFILDRKGNLTKRVEDLEQLEADIKSVL